MFVFTLKRYKLNLSSGQCITTLPADCRHLQSRHTAPDGELGLFLGSLMSFVSFQSVSTPSKVITEPRKDHSWILQASFIYKGVVGLFGSVFLVSLAQLGDTPPNILTCLFGLQNDEQDILFHHQYYSEHKSKTITELPVPTLQYKSVVISVVSVL